MPLVLDPQSLYMQWRRIPDLGCQDCYGCGEVFGHAGDCTEDLCALNGDYYSCAGQMFKCDCLQRCAAPAASDAAAASLGADARGGV